MDLSKLPKLSQTPPPPDNATAADPVAPPAGAQPNAGPTLYCRCGAPLPPNTRFCSNCGASYAEATGDARPAAGERLASGAEAWISVVMGLILLFMYPYFAQYLVSLAKPSYTPSFLPITLLDPQTGQKLVIPYAKSDFFLEHLAMFAFSIVLIVEGVALVLSRSKPVIQFALVITIAATLSNIWAVADGFRIGSGIRLFSALAAAFGIYIAIYQYSLLQSLRPRHSRIVS